MSSALEVQVANLSLSHIGQSGLVTSLTPPDGSANAEHCARFFNTARDTLLEMHTWSFATTRKPLTAIANPSSGWSFAYQVPTSVIRPIALLPAGSTDDTKVYPFVIEIDPVSEEKVLYTNVEDAVLRYIKRVADSSRWTPLFVIAMSWLLSHFIAGPITKKTSLVQETYKMFLTQYQLAVTADSESQHTDVLRDFTPAHLLARGISAVPDARILR
jgi:hypothetical protein